MKRKILYLIFVLFLVGGLTSILLYLQIWNPSWNPFRPSPNIVLAKMALKMGSLESYHVQGSLEKEEFNKKEYEEKKQTSNKKENYYNFSFSINNKDLTELKSKGLFDSNYYSEYCNEYIDDSDNDHCNDFQLVDSLEFVNIGDETYFLVKGKDDYSDNKWINFNNKEELGKLVSFYTRDYDLKESEINVPEEWKEELLEELIEIILKEDIFEVKEELPDEEINGQECYHYLLEIKEKGIKNAVSNSLFEISDFISDSVSVSFPEKSDYYNYQELDYLSFVPVVLTGFNLEIQQEVSDHYEKMGEINLEVWIDKKDSHLIRAKIDQEKDLIDYFKDHFSVASYCEILEARESFLLEINLSDFDEGIEIEAPEDFIEIEEMLKDRDVSMNENNY